MEKLCFLVSLTTQDNDFQLEQAAAAQAAAERLGVSVDILYADNDAIQQSQQRASFNPNPPTRTELFSSRQAQPAFRKWLKRQPRPVSLGLCSIEKSIT
jgi:hypothetical protein